MIERDLKLLKYLEKFRVLSRDQIGKLVCSDTANPSATATRICKRLSRDGYLTIIPQPRERPYLYMPKPPMIHPHSTHIEHFLTIADLYILFRCPTHFDVEPQFHSKYRPDAYTTINGEPVVIEVQRTQISNSKMQRKVDEFISSFLRGEHAARTLLIYSSLSFAVKADSGFKIVCGQDIFAPML